MSAEQRFTRDEYLAAALLEANIDMHFRNMQILVRKYRASGTTLIRSKGIAAIHYAAGMPETDFGRKAIALILEEGDSSNINVQTDDGEIALHIATYWGHVDIVKLLLQHGASIDVCDADGKNAVHYAINGDHVDILEIYKRFAYEQKLQSKAKCIPSQSPANLKSAEERLNVHLLMPSLQGTPTNRVPYNFDQTSPYYINITHRNKRMQNLWETRMGAAADDSPVNLFELNSENLAEFTRRNFEGTIAETSLDFIAKWKKKVDPLRQISFDNRRNSLIPDNIEELDMLIDSVCIQNAADCTEAFHLQLCSTEIYVEAPASPGNTNNTISSRDSFATANCVDESRFIRSPRVNDEFSYQMTEKYVHQDSEIGINVFEKKILPERFDRDDSQAFEKTITSIVSTEVTIPLEYDTDDLRAELTQFGAPPGPISSTTKKLYMKRLMRFKKKAAANLDMLAIETRLPLKQAFSWELERALHPETWSQTLAQYTVFVPKLTDSFRLQKSDREALREGHRKTSFVYLLMDPRVAENLGQQSKHVSQLDTWSTFLRSIFYVGKGKNGRPFAHLYDAIKTYQASEKFPESGSPAIPKTSDKIQRILDIWATGDKGVVCLQVFRNIVPTEAFTREAAIIDAIGLTNLTNIKTGDYYGSVKAWRLRERKQLGVALLYNALHVLLADGESQLRPDDLF